MIALGLRVSGANSIGMLFENGLTAARQDTIEKIELIAEQLAPTDSEEPGNAAKRTSTT